MFNESLTNSVQLNAVFNVWVAVCFLWNCESWICREKIIFFVRFVANDNDFIYYYSMHNLLSFHFHNYSVKLIRCIRWSSKKKRFYSNIWERIIVHNKMLIFEPILNSIAIHMKCVQKIHSLVYLVRVCNFVFMKFHDCS